MTVTANDSGNANAERSVQRSDVSDDEGETGDENKQIAGNSIKNIPKKQD